MSAAYSLTDRRASRVQVLVITLLGYALDCA